MAKFWQIYGARGCSKKGNRLIFSRVIVEVIKNGHFFQCFRYLKCFFLSLKYILNILKNFHKATKILK